MLTPSHSTPPPAAPRAARGRPPSPWELDHEWRSAPRRQEEPPPPTPAPRRQAARPLPTATEPAEQEDENDDRLESRRSAESVMEPRAAVHAPRRQAEPRPAATAPPQRPAPLHLPRSSAWPAMIFLSLGLLVFVFLAWQYLDDVKPGADDDLRPRRPIDQTAVTKMPEKVRTFLESLVPPPQGTTPGTPPWLWETPTLSKFVTLNGAALDNLRDLLEEADWHPAHAAWHMTDLGSDSRWRLAFLVKQAQAAYVARKGQEEDAFTAAVDLADLAWRLEQIWAWPSFYSRSLEAHQMAAQSLAAQLQNTRLPEPLLRLHQSQYSAREPKVEALTQALGAFYFHEKKLLLGAESGEPPDTMPAGAQLRRPGRLFFKPSATLQLFANEIRQLQMEARAPLANTGLVTTQAPSSARQRGYQPNSEGEVYFAARMAGYRSLPAQLALARARCGLVNTLFALHRHVAAQKTLPVTLDALKPHFLSDLPPDPFSASPLLYDRSRGLLWSVGTDFKSQGGQPTSPPMHDEAEPTVEIGIKIAVEASK
ncbi:MAG: hypothetical protein IPK32_21020 [Verrucomicrobiaceae bacterium]|nr:hypothetical protein [Verrucomicrobiaceae bacterium]